MQNKPPITLYHDTRSVSKKNPGKFPIKVRITWEVDDKWIQKYINTKQFVTTDEFVKVEKGKANTDALREIQEEVFKIRFKAQRIIDENPGINMDRFFSEYDARKPSLKTSVAKLFDDIIAEKNALEKIGTAGSYKDAKSSILEFGGVDLTIDKITVEWLNAYEAKKSSTTTRQKTKMSLNTIGIYLRNLRAVMKRAIKAKLLSAEDYPFGEDKYVIRKKKTKKKALHADIIKAFIDFVPRDNKEQCVKDYTLFSYFCNGMNFADMAYLTKSNFHGDSFKFIRRKTMDTVQEQSEIEVYLSSEIKEILHRLNKHSHFLLGIIDEKMSAIEKDKVIHEWIANTNEGIGKIMKAIGYNQKVTTYSMRHTFTTKLLNAGVPITKVKDALGHKIVGTTVNYAEDLDIETSKSFSNILTGKTENLENKNITSKKKRTAKKALNIQNH